MSRVSSAACVRSNHAPPAEAGSAGIPTTWPESRPAICDNPSVTESQLQAAQRRLEQTRLVQAMVDMLRALLDGRMSRDQASAWVDEQLAAKVSFRSAIAIAVFDSLGSITERDADGELLREVELRAYLDELLRGECVLMDADYLAGLPMTIDELGERVGVTPVRWWVRGLGWFFELSFATLASGRRFVARCHEDDRSGGVGIHKPAADPWQDALVDLFEHFAIDDGDGVIVHPDLDLAELPVWALWREDDNANKFEMARFRSYAKATAQEKLYRDRGHRQFYWVETS